jgi:hypothetical protein
MMRTTTGTLIILANALLAGTAIAQESLESPTLSQILGESFVLSFMPSYGWVSPGGGSGSALDARLFWPGQRNREYKTQLGIDLGLADLDYVRAGFDLRFRRTFPSFAPYIGVAGSLGSGTGPAEVIQVAAGADAGSFSFAVRNTWLKGGQGDRMPSMVPPAPVEQKYLDAEAIAGRHVGPLHLALAVGSRFGDHDQQRSWAFGTLTLPVRSHLGVSFASGWRPAQPERAQAGGAFAKISVRIEVSTEPSIPTPIRAPLAEGLSLSALPIVTGYKLRLIAGSAASVELKGDLTDWETRQLRKAEDGVWELDLPAQPGIYRINIRIDQREWRVPQGMVAVPDGYGGLSGVLNLN